MPHTRWIDLRPDCRNGRIGRTSTHLGWRTPVLGDRPRPKVLQDLREGIYTKSDEGQTSVVGLEDAMSIRVPALSSTLTQRARCAAFKGVHRAAEETVGWRSICLQSKAEAVEFPAVDNQSTGSSRHKKKKRREATS